LQHSFKQNNINTTDSAAVTSHAYKNNALRKLTDHPKYIVVEEDKNMGTVLMERDKFIKQIIKEHLGDRNMYKKLSPADKSAAIQRLRYKFDDFRNKHKETLGKNVLTFFRRSLNQHGSNVAEFRATIKVHKDPPKTRPVVATCGTFLGSVSKWLDYQLQPLMQYMPWCIKDSKTFREELIRLEIPQNAKLFTFDAISMYSNIDLNHGIAIMQLWLESLIPEDGHSIPTKAILDALELIMRNNIMTLGDTCFIQLLGTAMGTSVAVMFANLYFGFHEKHKLILQYKDNLKRLIKHFHFIDDVFEIWLGRTDGEWEQMKRDYNDFGILKWDFTAPSTSVNFLDLTIWIENGKILTRTYQKPNHPYLYIPPHSVHPPGCIKGSIYGLIRKYYEQNSRYDDFAQMTKLLFKRHLAR
jgi:hypothetical protein